MRFGSKVWPLLNLKDPQIHLQSLSQGSMDTTSVRILESLSVKGILICSANHLLTRLFLQIFIHQIFLEKIIK